MDRHEAFHNAIEYVPQDPWQSRPYVITIFVQALVAWFIRLPIVYFLLTVADWLIPVELNAPLLAFLIVFGPIAWSLAAFAFPGGGWFWRRYIGAREPSKREAKAILESFGAIGEEELAESLAIYVYPHPEYFAFARGRVVVYSSGLVKSDFLSAATAHEVAHLKSSDAILIQALDRFVLWGDPQPVFEGMSFLTFRNMVLRLLSGRLVLQALKPMWAEYFRERERAADENVVRLGLGDLLAELIENWELPREVPNPRVAFNLRDYLDPELRVEILTEEGEDDVAESGDDAGKSPDESEEAMKMHRIWEQIGGPGDWPDGRGDPLGESDDPPESGDPAEQPEDLDEPEDLEHPEDPGEPKDADEPEDADEADEPADADPPEEPKGAADEPGDLADEAGDLTNRPAGPPPEVSDPRDRWAELLAEDEGPFEEPEDMPDGPVEQPEDMPDEAEGLEGPPQ